MDKALVCGSALCEFIYQTVHPTGFGALEDCPNYKVYALRRGLALLTDRREMRIKWQVPIFFGICQPIRGCESG